MTDNAASTALQNGFVPRFWLCWRPWRLKVDLGRNYENLWESNIRSRRLDVQEANISVLQYYRIRDDITGCWFASGRYHCSWLVGCGDRSVTFVEWRTSSPKYFCIQKQTTRDRGKLQAQHPKHQVEERRWPKRWSVVKSRLFDHKRSLFSGQKFSRPFFEDNELVINMIIRGTSSMMRHVSRSHRVALDWLSDRINLDPKIQIKYVDTKNLLENSRGRRKENPRKQNRGQCVWF